MARGCSLTARQKTRRTRWRTRVARMVFPGLAWSGAGTISRKNFFEYRSGGAWVQMGGELQAGWAGAAPPTRWLLVVQDLKGKEHFVGVDADVWEQLQVGDVITAGNPLIDVS